MSYSTDRRKRKHEKRNLRRKKVTVYFRELSKYDGEGYGVGHLILKNLLIFTACGVPDPRQPC